ncbi:hypothetical protein A2U01_0011866, partial [Trifolium medium]|nr:hypothetical protein [Trifolium medium]
KIGLAPCQTQHSHILSLLLTKSSATTTPPASSQSAGTYCGSQFSILTSMAKASKTSAPFALSYAQ